MESMVREKDENKRLAYAQSIDNEHKRLAYAQSIDNEHKRLAYAQSIDNEHKHLAYAQSIDNEHKRLAYAQSIDNEHKRLAYAQSIDNAMALASRASKGFSGQTTMKQCGCEAVFMELLHMFLQGVNVPCHRNIIHVGVRQYLNRMVVCLEKEMSHFVPIVLEDLIKQPEAKELHDFIPLMNQLIMKFISAIIPFLQEVLLVSTIFHVLNLPTDSLDQLATKEKTMLQQSYYLLLSTVVTNDVCDVLKNLEPQNLHQVLITIIRGAAEFQDPCSTGMQLQCDKWLSFPQELQY